MNDMIRAERYSTVARLLHWSVEGPVSVQSAIA